MIELPRAALTADEIATEAEFFSFGTNDLTQTTFGLSRDDAGKFLPFYVDTASCRKTPSCPSTRTASANWSRWPASWAAQPGRTSSSASAASMAAIPSSVIFCHNVGLDYVSCSPFRVPIARLAAAHAALA